VNALVVYHSQFGNTQQVAEAIAQRLQPVGEVRTVRAERLTAEDLQDAGLLVMGTPTHKMNLPQAVRPVFEQLPKRSLRGVAIAAFDTSYKMGAFLARFTAAKKIDRSLRKFGGKRLVLPETFHVEEHHEGPLCEGEIERAGAWAETVLERYAGLSRRQGNGRR
jgi:flavodoxin